MDGVNFDHKLSVSLTNRRIKVDYILLFCDTMKVLFSRSYSQEDKPMDRSTRNLSIITLVVLAIFLALNDIAKRSGLADWGLVILLLLLAVAVWFYDRISRRGLDDDEMADTLIEPLIYEHQAGAISIPESIQVPAPVVSAPPVPSTPRQPEPIITAPPPAPSTPAVEANPPAAAPVTTTIEEKASPPPSAPAPETHPELAAKAPQGANLPSVPVEEKTAGEPVPTSVSGSAPEPTAPPAPAAEEIKVSTSEAAEATPPAPDPNLPKNANPDKPDDLKIIEGIGPKMEKALQAAGISTFAMLAGASETQIRAAITAAGMRFAPSVPTWAEQASYAANGDFVGLEAYQKTLVGGRKAK